jgi:predicted nucleotidyltransferase
MNQYQSETQLLHQIKQVIKAVEPEAIVLLYGSRARGDAKPDSDWDLLLLLDGEVNGKRISVIRRQIYEIEWETGEIFCTMVRNKQQWETSWMKVTPFWQSVNQDGIRL